MKPLLAQQQCSCHPEGSKKTEETANM